MGMNKALLPLDGRPMIQHVADTLRQVFERVVLISDEAGGLEFLTLPLYPDVYKDCGPLAGIHSAFIHTDAEFIFVSSCDTPFISTDLVSYLVRFPSDAPIRVAEADDRAHPLCGVYSRMILPLLEQSLQAKSLKLMDFLQKASAQLISITPDLPLYDPRLLMNINDSADYQALRVRLFP